jgi:CMP-N,N'-diacetyllegionaminic acid synthase
LKTLALITARGGSKGLPRKNLLPAGGKPLIAWTIEAAVKSKFINYTALTSEDEEIITTAKRWGCDVPFRRPAELASDTAKSIDVVLHALDQIPGFDFVVLLQPTSPLRSADDIDAAFKSMLARSAPSCISVCEADQSPYWMYRLTNTNTLQSILPIQDELTRRQDLPTFYVPNGAIYIARIDWLRANRSFMTTETTAFLMPKERSIDIDSAEDFKNFLTYVEINPIKDGQSK